MLFVGMGVRKVNSQNQKVKLPENRKTTERHEMPETTELVEVVEWLKILQYFR